MKSSAVQKAVRKLAAAPGKKRSGPAPLPAAELRSHVVSVRMNAAELDRLDLQRGSHQRGEWVRMSWLKTLPPPPAPAINREAWAELARAAGNLNQLARHLNAGGFMHDGPELAAELEKFRAALIAADGSRRVDSGSEADREAPH